ncbi:hypothetical protein [Dysgonomonas sp. 520]|uniref:hypothetical protein n=1 Tax=Dysgonomonas sp. 520 TaxID=2302931 RepID=UPI0013D46D70|nr:hypothetical protein [Dysgonomonas sp. 520]NDW09189.1 hypothetical protein [Dysgonomonas sp. 520]
MKKEFYILLSFVAIYVCSCVSAPKDFTYKYSGSDTGLGSLIDINGYYITQHEVDTALLSIFMFYPDGLFTIATTSKMIPELIDCFENGGKSAICKYPLWGTYRVKEDTIITQTIRQEGVGICTIFRNYKILPDKSIVNICDYVIPENTKIGNMVNYPSFYINLRMEKARFFPLDTKRNKKECPFINKKWFKGN